MVSDFKSAEIIPRAGNGNHNLENTPKVPEVILKGPAPTTDQADPLSTIRVVFGVLCKIWPSLAARWAEKLFFTPHSAQRPASEMPYFLSATKGSYEFGGRKIALYEWGQGDETIILVHGWGSRGTRLGTLAEPLNQRGFRVVAFDMPGHGDSDGKTTNLPEITRLLSQLHATYAPVHAMIGHSFGGVAVTAALHQYDLAIRRAAIISSPFTLDFVIESFAEAINLTPEVTSRMATAFNKRLKKSFNINIADLSPDKLVKTITLPVIVFHDKLDREVPFEQGIAYSEGLPNAKFVPTEGLGHRRILRDDNVISALVEFLSVR